MVSESAVRERAWVERREPPIDPIEKPMWVAEDPETDCIAVGSVEAEAVGNLVSVVAELEERERRGPLMKTPGRTLPRPGADGDAGSSVLDRLRDAF